ncbi:MAG: dihydroorotate dehydrogenase-like protein [Bacteroidales bacterium]|nr:dihydroorotate dehydrogenase-like protein [Bacteroidales bacterium]
MDTAVSYLGLKLKNPIVVGSSTFTGTVDGIKRCAEAGAGAVVLKSIFEEQILADIKKEEGYTDLYMSNPDADVYMKTFLRGNEISIYEKLIREAKETVDIPIIASINCTDKGEWISFAKEFENAGADALELNIAVSPFNREITSKDIEDEVVAIFSEVKKNVRIPVSVKLGNHFTNIGNLAFRLSMAGAAGLVLFNRYYNPTIDIETMKVVSGTALSVEEENSDTLRLIKILSSDGISCELSASTGVHTSEDVVRQLLAGAATVQVCSTLYKNGVGYISELVNGLEAWMKKHNFNSIDEFKGKCSAPEDIKIFERLQYLRRNNDLNL